MTKTEVRKSEALSLIDPPKKRIRNRVTEVELEPVKSDPAVKTVQDEKDAAEAVPTSREQIAIGK